MSGQETRVFKLAPAAGRTLGDSLTRAGWKFRPAPHAHWLAQGDGCTATWYRSGKFVVQGSSLDAWEVQHLPASARAVPGKKSAASKADVDASLAGGALSDDWPALGSDEAGKGDTFGGLVVAAVRLDRAGAEKLVALGLTDSKRLSAGKVHALAAHLRATLGPRGYAESVLEPQAYNERHAACGANVNRVLAEEHARLLSELFEQNDRDARVIVVDRFGASKPVGTALRKHGVKAQVVEVPRAERHAAVAAASVLARDRFVASLAALSERMAVDLPLGSGSPVGPAMRRYLEIHGAAAVGQVAKLHFRNVQAALARA
ncbi:MAG TPA: hypothetical protein VGC54_05100 [Planctomycetota bacterium]